MKLQWLIELIDCNKYLNLLLQLLLFLNTSFFTNQVFIFSLKYRIWRRKKRKKKRKVNLWEWKGFQFQSISIQYNYSVYTPVIDAKPMTAKYWPYLHIFNKLVQARGKPKKKFKGRGEISQVKNV